MTRIQLRLIRIIIRSSYMHQSFVYIKSYQSRTTINYFFFSAVTKRNDEALSNIDSM